MFRMHCNLSISRQDIGEIKICFQKIFFVYHIVQVLRQSRHHQSQKMIRKCSYHNSRFRLTVDKQNGLNQLMKEMIRNNTDVTRDSVDIRIVAGRHRIVVHHRILVRIRSILLFESQMKKSENVAENVGARSKFLSLNLKKDDFHFERLLKF